MPPKRPLDGASLAADGKAAKKAKTKAARTIEPQTTSPSGASSSRVRFRVDSSKGLPDTLDVEKFAGARSFEIGAMHKSMLTARQDASKRAWQTLPRHLRRRAASHDSRRVPVRLRDKARAELDPVKRKKAFKRLAKRGSTDIGRTEKLLKRQKDKTWLETHIWHAKRMKMDNIWGHRLALQPTEKSYRPSHRASVHGCILQDLSYYGILEVEGPENNLLEILGYCCDPQAPVKAANYVSGAQACETHIYKPTSFPLGLLSPCTIIWKPMDGTTASRKKNGKVKEATAIASTRTIWIHVHPATFEDAHATIQEAAATIASSSSESVRISDLRGLINAFELTGPKASQVLTGALQLTKEVEQAKKAWRSLATIQSPGSIPSGMVLGLQVFDPRLNFPPKNSKITPTDHPGDPAPAFEIPPSAEIARSALWNTDLRETLKKPKYTKKDLDKRREKNLIPGTRLHPTQDDARIPIIVIQRTIGRQTNSSRAKDGPQQLHGYLILLPAGWSMPFLNSLTYTGTRVGGLRDHATQRFESGALHFPQDYIGTSEYDRHWALRADEERERWGRTPKAKRVPYDVLPAAGKNDHFGWQPDWRGLLGLSGGAMTSSGSLTDVVPSDHSVQNELIPTQPNDEMDDLLDAMIRDDQLLASGPEAVLEPSWKATANSSISDGTGLVPQHTSAVPWLVTGSATLHLLDSLVATLDSPPTPDNVAEPLLRHVNTARARRGMTPLPPVIAPGLARSALVPVRLSMCSRGRPADISIIYSTHSADDDEEMWSKRITELMQHQSPDGADESNQAIPPSSTPDPSEIIGYVTTGRYALQKGKGAAIGAISLLDVVQIMRADAQANRSRNLCKLVRLRSRESPICRLARLDVITL